MTEEEKRERAARARAIVERVIRDIEGRKGLGDEWDNIAPDVQQEIKDAWVLTALEVLNG